jgi:hypothetical protein
MACGFALLTQFPQLLLLRLHAGKRYLELLPQRLQSLYRIAEVSAGAATGVGADETTAAGTDDRGVCGTSNLEHRG